MPTPFNEDPGALIDIRPEAEQQKDYSIFETVSAPMPADWKEKKQPDNLQFEFAEKTWRRFPYQNQDGSGSCVAQTKRKQFGVMNYVNKGEYIDFSASHAYQRRINRPNAGMGGDDIHRIAQQGIALNKFAASDEMNDAEMDAVKVTTTPDQFYKLGNWIRLPATDIDFIASTIQATKKAVMIWTYWNSDEWTEVPQILHPDLQLANASGRHSTAAVDFTLWDNNEKAIVMDESWNKTSGFNGQRVLIESFFKKRNWYAAYDINFAYVPGVVVRPHYTFIKALEFIPLNSMGYISDMVKNAAQIQDVKALQDILRYEGYFPTNVDSTGYFGGLTAAALYKYQLAHGVAPLPELNSITPRGGRFGPKSIAYTNREYS